MSTLMKPLFVEGMYNRTNKRMRAVFLKEITDGTTTYRLWRRDGKPDKAYPENDADKYYLHIEVNNILVPLGMTECDLTKRVGWPKVDELLYTRDGEDPRMVRSRAIDEVKAAYPDVGVSLLLQKEEKYAVEFGSKPDLQVTYIKRQLDKNVQIFLESKENGGETFPDFVGAAILNDLDMCDKLSAVYKVHRKIAEEERKRIAREKEAEEEQLRFKAHEAAMEKVKEVLLHGGKISNKEVLLDLADRLNVDIPIRTKGWIRANFVECSVSADGYPQSVTCHVTSNRSKGSTKIFSLLQKMQTAIIAEGGRIND